MRFTRQLQEAFRSILARAAALSVVLDVRTLSFCDGQPGMRELARIIFKTGQKIPSREKLILRRTCREVQS